jgi:hypothetical protein
MKGKTISLGKCYAKHRRRQQQEREKEKEREWAWERAELARPADEAYEFYLEEMAEDYDAGYVYSEPERSG